MVRHRLLVVDDDADDLDSTRAYLTAKGYEVETAGSGAEAISTVEREPGRFAVVVLDFQMQDLNGAEVTRKLKALNPDLFILIFSGEGGCDAFLLPLRQGACGFVSKGESLDVFSKELEKLVQRYEVETPASQVQTSEDAMRMISSVGMIGCSQRLARSVERALLVRERKGSVLLLGETGTGKECLARTLHSTRTGGFLAVNCGEYLLSKDLVRSELFGHMKGSFTGADKDKVGIFEAAKEGTSFIDELHHLPLEVQVALLRALQNLAVKRIGSHNETPISCRIVAGASPELFELVANGSFREDLFQRVAENIIRLPTLSQRPEDIPLLVEHFCKLWSEENRVVKNFAANTLPLLGSLPWRGNVRELRNVVFSTLNLTRGNSAKVRDIETVLDERRIKRKEKEGAGGALKKELDSMKKAAVIKFLATSSSLRDAARKMNVAPSTVSRYVIRHGIDVKSILGRDRADKGATA